jgi:hypothetical protein
LPASFSPTTHSHHTGIPFFNVTPPQLQIAETGQAILGDFLLGLQAGNEPDLYTAHNHRPSASTLQPYCLTILELMRYWNEQTYSQYDYFGEFGTVVAAVNADSNIPNKNCLIGPNLATNWSPESMWNTGFIGSYTANLAYVAFER